MSAAIVLPDLSTPEACLAWIERQPMKYEMTGGRLVSFPHCSNAHVRVAGNAFVALRTQLRGRRCRPYNSDFMVQVTPSERYYPDTTVACDETRDYTDRPVLVVEVLSPSTERFDRATKLPRYLAKSGLEYVLYVAQDRAFAQLYRPGEAEGDVPIEVSGLEERLELPELGVALAMADLYADVDLAA